MTHIIQSPKPRKQGATFADVPVGVLFTFDGETHLKESESTARMLCPSSRIVHIQPHFRVTLLSVQPIDPEPDPDAWPYGELEAGERFAVPGGLGTLARGTRTNVGWVSDAGCHYEDGDPDNPLSADDSFVRRVSASVVEHEEPGTALVRYSNGDIELMPEHGSRHVSLEQLAALVRQGAAVVAQQAASPESGEPEPAEGRCEVDSRCTRPAGHGGCCWSDTWHEKQDRSKPAPGWTVEEYGGDGYAPVWAAHGPGETAYRRFETSAVAWTWAQHDAQQAGKGGES